MVENLDNLVKSITLARKKGVVPSVMHKILKTNAEIKPVVIDGVNHYDITQLPPNFLVRRKENKKK